MLAFDAATFAASLIGGTLGGTSVTVGVAWWRERNVRKGRARLMHQDLLHSQSMLARTFYQEGEQWWDDAWVTHPAANNDDRRDLFVALKRDEYAALARALGWIEYLTEGKKARRRAPNDDELTEVYEQLAAARYALRRVGRFEYRAHRHRGMKPEHGGRTDGRELPDITSKQAEDIVRTAVPTDEPQGR